MVRNVARVALVVGVGVIFSGCATPDEVDESPVGNPSAGAPNGAGNGANAGNGSNAGGQAPGAGNQSVVPGAGNGSTAGNASTSGTGGNTLDPDGGVPPDDVNGPAPAVTPGDKVGEFTYYEVDGAVCRDGSPAGYYARKGSTNNLMVFLNGGGVCFDDFFCGINPANVDQSLPGEDLLGATLDQLSSALQAVRQTPPDEGVFKQDPTNPVKDWNMVYVPYCTGDVYAGTTHDAPVITSTEGQPPQQFVGYTNLGLFYKTFAETLGAENTAPEKLLLTGSSAGGFGTLLNFDRTQTFFSDSRVYAVTDSGFPFRDQFLEPCIQKKWRDLWGIDKILPKDCTECFHDDGGGLAEGLGGYIFKQKYAGRMLGGGISSNQDQIIKLFFSAGLNNCTTDTATEAVSSVLGGSSYPPDRYPQGLDDFLDNVAGRDSVGSYFIDSDLHQHLFRARFYEENGTGKTMAVWLGDILNDQAEQLGSTASAAVPDPAP